MQYAIQIGTYVTPRHISSNKIRMSETKQNIFIRRQSSYNIDIDFSFLMSYTFDLIYYLLRPFGKDCKNVC